MGLIILAFDGAWRTGASPETILDAIVAKQKRNELRDWPDWREGSEDKAIEHDRTRPAWDDYFLNLARAVSTRADCRRARHGAVITKDHRIVSTGYNGSVAGGKSCLAGECPRGLLTLEELASNTPDYSNCIALHAEQNAIAYARGDGDTIYVTGAPCDMCGKLIQAAGIERVVYG